MNQVPTVVSGAMIPVKWDKGTQYQMKRNDLYYKGKTYLDSYYFKVVADAVQVANQLKTGEIDVGQPDLSQWDSLANVQNIDRLSYVAPAFDYYIQNLDPAKTPKAAIFGDAQVRKALLTALDRKAVARCRKSARRLRYPPIPAAQSRWRSLPMAARCSLPAAIKSSRNLRRNECVRSFTHPPSL